MFHANPRSIDTINELEIQQSSSLCMHVTHKFSNRDISKYSTLSQKMSGWTYYKRMDYATPESELSTAT